MAWSGRWTSIKQASEPATELRLRGEMRWELALREQAWLSSTRGARAAAQEHNSTQPTPVPRLMGGGSLASAPLPTAAAICMTASRRPLVAPPPPSPFLWEFFSLHDMGCWLVDYEVCDKSLLLYFFHCQLQNLSFASRSQTSCIHEWMNELVNERMNENVDLLESA